MTLHYSTNRANSQTVPPFSLASSEKRNGPRKKNRAMWVAGALAVFTNGWSILGHSQASAGSVARNIECNQTIARSIESSMAASPSKSNPPRTFLSLKYSRFTLPQTERNLCQKLFR